MSGLDRSLNNDSTDPGHNGERWLLEQLAPLGPRTVLDVGAHRGEWTSMALDVLPDAEVHAFEPVPATYERLVAAVGASPRVVAVNAALTVPGRDEAVIWTRGGSDTMSSLVESDRAGLEPQTISCLSGDAYLSENGISHVDLLKVDVEGHDLDVLDGFSGALAGGSVEVVQFEFTLWAVHARRWLGDYYDLLGPLGYAIGKLHPRRVRWKDYQPEDERFLRCNFVAVRGGSTAAAVLGAG